MYFRKGHLFVGPYRLVVGLALKAGRPEARWYIHWFSEYAGITIGNCLFIGLTPDGRTVFCIFTSCAFPCKAISWRLKCKLIHIGLSSGLDRPCLRRPPTPPSDPTTSRADVWRLVKTKAIMNRSTDTVSQKGHVQNMLSFGGELVDNLHFLAQHTQRVCTIECAMSKFYCILYSWYHCLKVFIKIVMLLLRHRMFFKFSSSLP